MAVTNLQLDGKYHVNMRPQPTGCHSKRGLFGGHVWELTASICSNECSSVQVALVTERLVEAIEARMILELESYYLFVEAIVSFRGIQ